MLTLIPSLPLHETGQVPVISRRSVWLGIWHESGPLLEMVILLMGLTMGKRMRAADCHTGGMRNILPF